MQGRRVTGEGRQLRIDEQERNRLKPSRGLGVWMMTFRTEQINKIKQNHRTKSENGNQTENVQSEEHNRTPRTCRLTPRNKKKKWIK